MELNDKRVLVEPEISKTQQNSPQEQNLAPGTQMPSNCEHKYVNLPTSMQELDCCALPFPILLSWYIYNATYAPKAFFVATKHKNEGQLLFAFYIFLAKICLTLMIDTIRT